MCSPGVVFAKNFLQSDRFFCKIKMLYLDSPRPLGEPLEIQEKKNMKLRVKILFLALVLSLCWGPPTWAAEDIPAPFEDVDASAWYSADVMAAYQSGLFAGVSDTAFEPTGTLSLAQSATLAARLHQYARTGKVTLQNGKNTWYSTYVNYCKKNSILGGEYEGRWDENATRAEMVKILYYALDADSYAAVNTVEDNAIPDVKTGWASCDEIYAFYRAGILTGGEGNCFNSKSTIQRCEVAAILNRMLNPDQRQSVTLVLPELPDPGDTDITAEKVLAVLDRLDPDGAFIIRSASGVARAGEVSSSGLSASVTVGGAGTSDDGTGFLSWWPSSVAHLGADGKDEYVPPWLVEEMETAVHEESHVYTALAERWDTDRYYIGGGEYVDVTRTKSFPAREITGTIPESLRTFRFSTYIDTASKSPSTQASGVYGLLNEWTAYYWGAHNDWMLKDYDTLRIQTVTIAGTGKGSGGGSNSRSRYRLSGGPQAYAEFRYYILRYMLYAKEKHPNIYQEILDNTDFCLVFTVIDESFGGLAAHIREWNLTIYERDWQGGITDSLMKEMEKPEYQEMLARLKP